MLRDHVRHSCLAWTTMTATTTVVPTGGGGGLDTDNRQQSTKSGCRRNRGGSSGINMGMTVGTTAADNAMTVIAATRMTTAALWRQQLKDNCGNSDCRRHNDSDSSNVKDCSGAGDGGGDGCEQ